VFTPISYLQSSFNLTLEEYSKQTGIDLIEHSFGASFDHTETAIAAVLERTRVSSNSETDGPMAQLIKQLNSITRIVSLLSPTEALSESIDLVSHRELDLKLS
jgi:hypothetical protein